ncbi:type IV toxin-antitoxin system AbiEi family antitoxin domain-containing protein [uncultured Friedmanniella sp.]|uniref:type IV toxin-antitoxin system AbiEi family antitoxin domain-containing protein n=1 Tax=uncultured Friedmanniella sp. TaxID=335381 RepID=UPI0035CB096D
MHSRLAVPEGLLRLASQQAGVLTTEQALGFGLSEPILARLCRDGLWTRLGRGVYRTGEGDPDWSTLAWAGVLLGGDEARLGPHASAYLWSIGEPPDPVDVLVPVATSRVSRGHWAFVRERPGVRSARTVGSPPRLTAADTVLDLVAGADQSAAVDLVIRATAQRVVSPAALRRSLGDRAQHRYRALLQELLGDVADGVESRLELRYLRDVERAHGLPEGNRQRYRGGLRHRTDVGYDDFALLVELDGRLGHEGAGRFRDYRRDNDFALRQLLTLRYGWFDVVDRPCRVAFQVGSVMVSRGWLGLPQRCSRCVQVPVADLC